MTILVHIRKKTTGLWYLDTTILAIDGVLGSPFFYNLKSQADAVDRLSQNLDNSTNVATTHLFTAYQISNNIDPDDDLDIEISVPNGYGYLPVVVFRPIVKNPTGLVKGDTEDQPKRKVDLLQLMSDVLGI